jgi:hypothetical protein
MTIVLAWYSSNAQSFEFVRVRKEEGLQKTQMNLDDTESRSSAMLCTHRASGFFYLLQII